jgi:hypothetical protein
MQKLIAVCLFALLQTACAIRQVDFTQIEVAQGVSLPLLAPETLGRAMILTQSADIRFKGNQHSLIFHSEFTKDSIIVVGLMPSGTRVFTLKYDGVLLTVEGIGEIIEKINPGYLMADLQFSLWPQAALQSAFEENSNCFIAGRCQFESVDDSLTRKLLLDGQPIISVNYQSSEPYQGSIEFYHLTRDYRLSITFLEALELESQ